MRYKMKYSITLVTVCTTIIRPSRRYMLFCVYGPIYQSANYSYTFTINDGVYRGIGRRIDSLLKPEIAL